MILKTDEELYTDFLNGNKQAFEELVIKYRKNLTYFISRYTKDIDNAEDLAQDVFIYILTNKNYYNPKNCLLVNSYDTAIRTMKLSQNAIDLVSQMRSSLGAVQNRLEHTIANLDNIAENTTAAESRIRDTDMAKEMVEYSTNNILMQAGQSMLAQANQSRQGILSLLQ